MKIQYTNKDIGDFGVANDDSLVTILNNSDGTAQVVGGVVQTTPLLHATKIEYKGNYFIDFNNFGDLEVSASPYVRTIAQIQAIAQAGTELPESFNIHIIVADTQNGNFGYREDIHAGTISTNYLGITYIGTYFENFIISMPKKIANYDTIYVSIFDKEPTELVWDDSSNKYSAHVDNIIKDMEDLLGQSMNIIITV